MLAIVFPGQGSQYLNMAIDFNHNYIEAKNTFQMIEDITKIKIRKIISENHQNKLNQTNYTQISIFAASMAIYNTLLNQVGYDRLNPKFVLGHSLGEYSALVANKTLNLDDASNLIKIRGDLMNSAIEPNTSGMAAIIGKSADLIDEIIEKNKLEVTIANDNSPMQVVVSGILSNINSAESVFISSGVKKYIKLNVSAAFHSKYMENAQIKLINEINKVNFNKVNIPIITNYDANINTELATIKEALKKQMANKVKWTESIKKLEVNGINKIIEIGPSKVLSSLISRISKNFDIISINNVDDFKKFE